MDKALFGDSIGTGALFGTSNTTYVESAAGIVGPKAQCLLLSRVATIQPRLHFTFVS